MYGDFETRDLSSASIFFARGKTTYWGENLSSTSTPILRTGRSRTCPYELRTTKPSLRKREIVRSFAGDSTTTSDGPLAPLGALAFPFAGAVFLVAFFAIALTG